MKSKLVILGGNAETAAFIKKLNTFNIYTIVIDPNKDAPAKKYSDESYEIDGMDIQGIYNFLKNIQFDGLMVGVADILVPSYFELCQRLNLPCYANLNTIKAFGSKDGFNSICEKHKISVIPKFNISSQTLNQDNMPVLVKPVDNGAGVGMTICKDIASLNNALKHAKENSKSKRVLVEKYMMCDDFFAYYTFLDGNIYLSATADRHKSRNNNLGSPVCIGATYPSKYHHEFVNGTNIKILRMLKNLDISDGVLNIQFFRDKKDFYAYDPGFRLQGEAPHIHILHSMGIDQRELLANFALGKKSDFAHSILANRHVGDKLNAATAWVLLNEGVIKNIEGLDQIKKLNSFKEIIQRLSFNDEVTSDMIDTERQVFARVYFQNDNIKQLKADLNIFSKTLKISSNKSSLISDIFDDSFL